MRFFFQQKTTTSPLPNVHHIEIEESEDALQIRYQPQPHFLFSCLYCGIGLVFVPYILWCAWFIVWHVPFSALAVISPPMSLYIAIFMVCELLSFGTQWKIHIDSEFVKLEWRCGKISGFLLSLFHVKTEKIVQFDRKDIVGNVNKNSLRLTIYNVMTLKQFREPGFVTMMTYAVISGHFQVINGHRHYLPVIIAPLDKPQEFSRWLIHKINHYLETHPIQIQSS